MNMQQRDKLALTLGGIAVAVFVILQFAVMPAWDSLQERREEIPIREKQLIKSRQMALETTSFTAAANSAEARLREAEAGLLGSTTASVAAAELQDVVKQISSSEAIEIRSNQFLPAKPLSVDYTEVPVGIDIQCRLDQLVSLLARLAQAPKYVAVQKLTISSSNNKEKTVGAHLQLAGVMRSEQKKQE